MNTQNQSAFPLPVEHGFTSEASIGLTKREYFAGAAMQGLLANSHDAVQVGKQGNNPMPVPANIAELSIQLSDELLKQLEK